MIDMAERYGELTLYAGLTPRDGTKITEGQFWKGSKHSYQRERWYEAMGLLHRYFGGVSRDWIDFCSFDRLVETDAQAEEFIAYAKAHISRAHDVLEPDTFCHGKLRFRRKLRIEGVGEADAERLVEALKGSGYAPKDEEVEELLNVFGLGRLMEGTPEEKRQKLIVERSIDPNRAWYKSLRFYDENGNRVGADPEDDE